MIKIKYSLGDGIRGFVSKTFLTPEKVSFFDDKNIIQITCGSDSNHCLALSSDGVVYGWGGNRYGKVRCGKTENNFILTPIELDLKEKIKFVHCTRYMSFAVSFDGNAYYWGEIERSEDIFIPKLIALKNVLKIDSYKSHELLIILDKHREVFEFNYSHSNGQLPRLFKDIF